MTESLRHKIEALSQFKTSSEVKTYIFKLHGVTIRLRTRIDIEKIPFTLEIAHKLENFDLLIHLGDQSEYFYSDKKWDDLGDDQVISSGAYFIQRDFIYARQEKDSYIALIDPNNTDGIFNLLRHLLPSYLAQRDQAIVHSSCVRCHNGEAILFLGHSTYGKTTITELATPRLTLSDDMNIISYQDGILFASPSRLGARYESKEIERVPIREVYWLNKGEKFEVIPLTKSQALLYLTSSVPSYYDILKESSHIQTLLTQIAQITKIAKLTFPKNQEVWNELDPR